ncbi:hypothetical protein IHE45_19G078800 [Dioscorea alata]|uniref:Uncharacterized protein n=1 Tax=Dioscorea alata TaxID=55571 RepID=A0ACB7TZB9_DIOAL|nr:hypothetical protein IHE45_19G078800 [Dioscorea alata]
MSHFLHFACLLIVLSLIPMVSSSVEILNRGHLQGRRCDKSNKLLSASALSNEANKRIIGRRSMRARMPNTRLSGFVTSANVAK